MENTKEDRLKRGEIIYTDTLGNEISPPNLQANLNIIGILDDDDDYDMARELLEILYKYPKNIVINAYNKYLCEYL